MKRKHKTRRRRRAPIRVPKRPELAAPPGVVVPPDDAQKTRMELLGYGPEVFKEEQIEDPERVVDVRSLAPVCWLNVEGVGEPSKLKRIAEIFGWHPLVVEDVVSLHQRPKAEEYDDHVYVVMLMPSGTEGLPLEQLSLLFGEDYVVTVQAGIPGDTMDAVRERIRKARGRIRGATADYLAYAVIDAVIDHYFPIVEKINERLENLEANLGQAHEDTAFADIHAIRNNLHTTWRAVSATGEAVGRLVRGEAGPVSDSTRLYLRDCQDHCAQLLDAIGACRELSSSLMELHESAISNRMSEGMRILTMIATIFIPMSFIAGVYGMNFDPASSPLNMPELKWYFGYPFALALMLVVGIGFISYFRRRGWLGPPSRSRSDPARMDSR